LIAAVVAAMIAFDLGGPVNKAAYGISLGIFNTPEMSEIARFTPNTAVQLSIILPPLSLGLASIIGKKYYDDDIKESGKAAFIMGLVGVSEGAIPFAIKNPIRVTILNVIGCVCAAVFAVALGSLQEVNLSAFYS
jgi:PTS system fructose-specific IIC component